MSIMHSRLLFHAAIAALLFLVSGCHKYGGKKHPPGSKEPASFVFHKARPREVLSAEIGSTLTLEAPVKHGGLIQWMFDGKPIPDATQSTLVISPVSTNHAGYYSFVSLSKPVKIGGVVEEPCPEVEVQTYMLMNNTNITVWGKAIPQVQPVGGGCPGAYVALAAVVPKSGYGWYPKGGANALHMAIDGFGPSSGCSKVEFIGEWGDWGCDSPGSVIVPNQSNGYPLNPRYRFTVYFPVGCTYTNPHPVTLVNFGLSP